MLSRDYRSIAREALRGYWGVSILVTLAASLLGGYGSPAASSFGSSASSAASPDATAQATIPIDLIPPAVTGIVIALLSLLAIYALVTMILGGAVRLGLAAYNIDLVTKRRKPVFSTLFSRFSIFGKAFMLQLLISVFTALWALLFIIPGIIASYRYAMAPYILSENPNLSASEALKLSKQMMKGNKWRLFKLQLSFIGWAILTAFTLGIGSLWLTPYTCAAEAAFYLDVAAKENQRLQGPDLA